MATLLQIVTPEGRVFSDMVDQVVVPGSEGELGVLTLHAALVSALKPGELRYLKDGQEHIFAVGSGLLEVTQSGVAILSDLAINEKDTDDAHPEDIVALELSIAHSLAQLAVRRRRHHL